MRMCVCMSKWCNVFMEAIFQRCSNKNSVTRLMKNMLDGTMCNLQFKNAMNIVFNFLTKLGYLFRTCPRNPTYASVV